MSLIETKTGRKYLRKIESLMLVPFVYEKEYDDYILGEDVYDISAIIADTLSLEQKDGDVTEKFNEFVRSPLVRNVTAGAYDFTAQCLDLQDKVLKVLFGALPAKGNDGDVEGLVAMPDDNKLLYAMVRIRFKDDTLSDIILPKVQIDSKMVLQQMKSHGGQGNISGTALPRMTAVDDIHADHTVVGFTDTVADEVLFAINTPVLFVPRDYPPMVLHHYDSGSDRYIFSMVDFSTGDVYHDRSVNISNGTYEIL